MPTLGSIQARAASPLSTWYLAEGSNAWGFSTDINVENPNSTEVTARLTILVNADQSPTGNGIASRRDITLAAESGTVVFAAIPDGVDFSTKVECLEGLPIAVDRTMRFGISVPRSGVHTAIYEPCGAHCSIGVNAPANHWYLPEGSSAWGFECWTLIMNPDKKPANVTLKYMVEGSGPRSFKKVVPPFSRATFNMQDDIGEADASIEVTSDQPVIAERSMYTFADEAQTWIREGTVSIGATTTAKDCYLAEGSTAWGFTTYVLIQNPNEVEAQVKLTCDTTDGAITLDSFTLSANSRRTVRLNDLIPATDSSIQLHSDQGIAAERSMYWKSPVVGGSGMHDSIGAAAAHLKWYLPSGGPSASSRAYTYTCIQNPGLVAVTVEITLLTGMNFTASNRRFTDEIPANSRKTYNLADKIPSDSGSIMAISMVANRPIVVESSTYFFEKAAGMNTIGACSD